jgi:hypothetical protein
MDGSAIRKKDMTAAVKPDFFEIRILATFSPGKEITYFYIASFRP